MDDWKPGDLALCVRNGRAPDNPTRAGHFYIVERVWINRVDGLALDFCGIFNGDASPSLATFHGHDPARFRKINDHTPDAEDAETIGLLTGKPVAA